jgi:hypothetical protein
MTLWLCLKGEGCYWGGGVEKRGLEHGGEWIAGAATRPGRPCFGGCCWGGLNAWVETRPGRPAAAGCGIGAESGLLRRLGNRVRGVAGVGVLREGEGENSEKTYEINSSTTGVAGFGFAGVWGGWGSEG